MKATAHGLNGAHEHEVEIGSFRFATGAAAGEECGGGKPTPQELLAASLAACSALTMEAYAKRKGWDIGEVVVEVDYELARRGSPARCGMVVRLCEHVPADQRDRLMSVAATSPMHRTLEGETMFDERLGPNLSDASGSGQDASPPPKGNGLLGRLRPSSPRAG